MGAGNQKHWGEDMDGRRTSLYKGYHSTGRRGHRVRSEAWRDAGIAVKARIPPFAYTTTISHLGKLSREFQKGLETSHR